MKKLFLIIMILSISALFLFGCGYNPISSTTQNYESYTYDVIIEETKVGSLYWVSERYKDGGTTTVTIGGESYENSTGTKISYTLDLDNTNDGIISEIFLTTSFEPLYMYKQIIKDGVTTSIKGSYSEGKYIYTLTTGDNTEEKEIKVSGGFMSKTTYYDNEMIYYLLRCADLAAGSYSLTFTCPSPIEGDMMNLTATEVSTLAEVTGAFGSNDAITCYHVSLSANDTLNNSSYSLYYAVNSYEIAEEDVTIIKPLIQIVEGNYTYLLKSVTTVRE